jgi:hypothetical protein
MVLDKLCYRSYNRLFDVYNKNLLYEQIENFIKNACKFEIVYTVKPPIVDTPV